MNEIVYDLALAGLAFFIFGPRAMCTYLMAMTVYYMVKMAYLFARNRGGYPLPRHERKIAR